MAMQIGVPWCLHAPGARSNLERTFQEMAGKVWIARHWSEERMVDAWASCVAEQLATCGEKVPSTLSIYEAVHLWAHDTGVGPCRERRVSRRLNAAAHAMWLDSPDLHAEFLEEMRACRPHRCEWSH